MPQKLACNFDEASGDVVDHSGSGHGFALNNGLTRVTGHSGASGLSKLGGAGSMGTIADPSWISAGPGWTVMFWLQNPGNGTWLFRFYNTAADTGSGLLILGGTLRLRLRTAAGSNVEVTTSVPPNDNSWHHHAITYDGSVGKHYVDAALVNTTAVTPSLAAINRIDFLEATLTNFATDDLRIYDEALDLATITTLKNSSPPDATGSTGTLDLALSGVSSVMSGQAQSVGALNVALSGPALALAGQAHADGQLEVVLSGPSLVLSGVASAVGSLGLVLGGPTLLLRQEQAFRTPSVAGPGQPSPLLVDPAVLVAVVLASPPEYG